MPVKCPTAASAHPKKNMKAEMQEDCKGTHQVVTTRLEFPLGQRAEGARGSLNMSQRPEAGGAGRPGGRAQEFTQAQIKCCLAKWFSKVDPVSGTPSNW